MRLNLFTKNVHSLQGEEQLEQLVEELKGVDWDIILATESWRADKEEVLDLVSGHLFVGPGGLRGERGVALLIHKR